jgi:hypothetical protein
MRTRKIVNFPRPKEAPENWEIYNAPRPLFGTREDNKVYTWEGEFISGIFYAAINPDDPDANMWREENERLHAIRLEYVTRQSVINEMVEYYNQKYPNRVEKIFAKHPLKEKETQKMLIDTWFNLDMNWSDNE